MHLIADDVINGCKENDRLCQQKLYEHCYADMLKLCMLYCGNSVDAGMLYNSAMLKVFAQIQAFKGEGSFMGWIRRIVVNTCIDQCRKKVTDTLHPIHNDEADTVYIPPDAYAKIAARELIGFVQQLPVNAALVFNLYVIEGYKHEEIANMIGIATGTSKWYLNEARRLLKEKIYLFTKTKNYTNAR